MDLHMAVGHVRDIGSDALLARDAIADAKRAADELEEIDDREAALSVLKIVSDLYVEAGSLLLALERKIELAP